MNEFYEFWREQAPNISVSRNKQQEYMAHYHNNVEIYILNDGEQRITCNGLTYKITNGTVVFFDSYDIHEYIKPELPCKDNCVLIFPFRYLTNFRAFRKKLKVSSPIIHDKELAQTLLKLVDGILTKTKDENLLNATVDMILAFVEQKLDYSSSNQTSDISLVKKIIEYIYANFKTDLRLSTIAYNLGYTEEHLSREFHKIINQSIPSYVNKLRLDYVENELKKGEKKLVEIIYEAGFNNLQTYHRNKKAQK